MIILAVIVRERNKYSLSFHLFTRIPKDSNFRLHPQSLCNHSVFDFYVFMGNVKSREYSGVRI